MVVDEGIDLKVGSKCEEVGVWERRRAVGRKGKRERDWSWGRETRRGFHSGEMGQGVRGRQPGQRCE